MKTVPSVERERLHIDVSKVVKRLRKQTACHSFKIQLKLQLHDVTETTVETVSREAQ